MDLSEIEPVILYDDRCSACSSFARIVDTASRGRFTMVGHYTQLGSELGALIGEGATEMFWVIGGGYARGGRAGLAALASHMLRRSRLRRAPVDPLPCSGDECGTPRAVLYRSCSVLRRSRTVRLENTT